MTTYRLSDPATVAEIAELESGWASAIDIAWTIAGDDYKGRSRVKTALNDLSRSGLIEKMSVRHRGEPLPCFKIDPPALQALIREWAQ